MASVRFENVGKIYPNGHEAIRGLDLQIADGELMVFVGPSGCGKSTLLRLLAGLEDISSGRILIGERVANALTPQERNIAMVFQDYALYPNMTVRGNLDFPLRMRKLNAAEIRKRSDRIAEMLGLSELMERLPKQLSGGQRQRVAMGRALVREPAVFLLDEPLSNLDAKLRVQVRAEIGELQKHMGTTMIYVTHDQVEAMTLGERIAVLDAGRLQQVAEPKNLYERPANPFVAGFIGSPPMNLFTTQFFLAENGQPFVELGTQRLPAKPPGLEDDSLQLRLDQPVTCGIRPEAFRISEIDGLFVEALWVEFLGHETLLHFQPVGATPDSLPMVARLSGMHVFHRGENLRLSVRACDIHLFSHPAPYSKV